MAAQEEAVELPVKFEPVEDVKSEWVETVTRELGNELEARTPSTTSAAVVSEVPQGARALLIPELGALAFQVRPRVLPELMGCLRDWLQARRGKVVKVVVTFGGPVRGTRVQSERYGAGRYFGPYQNADGGNGTIERKLQNLYLRFCESDHR